MDTAERIVITYGVVSLAFGFLLGTALSRERTGSPVASRHLVTAHLSAIIQGAVHLGLSIGLALSALTPWLETTAAVLLVIGSALFVAGTTANWLQQVGDHFAARSLGWKLLATSSIGHLAGITLVLVGVVTAG